MFRYPVILSTILVIILLSFPQSLFAEKPTVIGGDIIVNIDGVKNSGSTQIHLRNNTKDSIKLLLHTKGFLSKTTNKKSSAKVVFQKIGSQEKNPVFDATLDPDKSLLLNMEISDFMIAGEAHAQLLNGNDELTTIKAAKFNVPFNVGLDTPSPENPELDFQRKKPGLLVFKNEDSMSYPVAWTLILPNAGTVLSQSKSPIIVPAKSTIPEEFDINSDAFTSWFSGFFKDNDLEGRLVLRFAPPSDVAHPDLPVRTIPVKLKLRYWSSTVKKSISSFVILMILIIGGLCSVFLNLWIPNKLKRIDLLRRIELLSRKTQAISTKIDSSLRVGVRVERLRLAQLIRSVWLFNTDASTLFENYKSDRDLLDRRVGLIQKLDRVLETLENLRAKTADAPAKILDDLGKQIVEATELLKLAIPEEASFQRAEEIIRSTDELLRNITNEDPQLVEKLATWVVKLKELYNETNGTIGTLDKCKELRPHLQELFNVFDNSNFEDKTKIEPVHYHWLSNSIERLYILRHYIRAWGNSNPERREIIKAQEKDLLRYLKIRTWNALNNARRLRTEIEENIFIKTIETELANKAVSISTVPIRPLPNEMVRLEVQFNRRDLNTSTAKQEFTPVWDFGDIGKEEGWQIYHYFTTEGAHTFSVSFQKPDGSMLKKHTSDDELMVPVPVQVQPPGKKQYGERWKIEAIQLAVALGVAILGLISGAQEKLMNMDVFSGLVGVFVLGFGADTVKNIITRRSQGET